jgi:1-acyl-sn-glycerol-3-phosphate acyltransferase
VIWLRSAIFLVLLGLAVVLYGIPISLLGRFLSPVWLNRLARSWARSVLGLLKLICGLGYRVDGIERLPPEPAIVLCKHQSAWETIALRAILPPSQTWVLKRELVRLPVFGWALAVYEPIAIDRAAGRRAMKQLLDQGKRALQKGRWVIIFPEGTRVAPGEHKAYGIGGALLAEKSGRPVVPIAHNAGIFWGRRSFLKRPGVIELKIGAPIPARDRGATEINREAERWIEATVAELPTHPG